MNYDILKDVVLAVLVATPGILALKSTINLNRAKEKSSLASVEKSNAEIVSLFTDAAADMVEQYKAEIDDIRAEMKDSDKKHKREISSINKKMEEMQKTMTLLRSRLREYRQGVLVLIEQIKKLGETPKYILPEDKMEGE